MPAVDLLEAEAAERDVDALRRLAEERVLTASVRRVVLREAGREEPAGDARPRAVEVVRALRTPASAASDRLELTCAVAKTRKPSDLYGTSCYSLIAFDRRRLKTASNGMSFYATISLSHRLGENHFVRKPLSARTHAHTHTHTHTQWTDCSTLITKRSVKIHQRHLLEESPIKFVAFKACINSTRDESRQCLSTN